MATADLGKVALTFAGNYSPSTLYDKLTVVVGTDGQTYVTKQANVINVSPGVSANWSNYWQVVSPRGPQGVGITNIRKTSTSGTNDTYTIYYSDGATDTFVVSNGKGIQSIEKTGSGVVGDTYTITFGNNQTATFTVTNGQGVPSGGSEGQVVSKASDTDYDTTWITIRDAAFCGVANDLTTVTASLVLDARQGRILDNKKFDKDNVANNLATAAAGYALDARQGKILNDKILSMRSISVQEYTINASDWVYTSTGTRATYEVANMLVTADSICIVTPDTSPGNDFFSCHVRAGAPKDGYVTFVADMPQPNSAVNVRVVIIGGTTYVPK